MFFRSFPRDWRVLFASLHSYLLGSGWEYRARMDFLPGESEKTKSPFVFFCVYNGIEREANSGWYFIFASADFSLPASWCSPCAPLLIISSPDQSPKMHPRPPPANPCTPFHMEISRQWRNVFNSSGANSQRKCYEKRYSTILMSQILVCGLSVRGN